MIRPRRPALHSRWRWGLRSSAESSWAFSPISCAAAALLHTDFTVGQWGVDNATSWSTQALRLVTDLGGTRFVVVALVVVALVEYRPRPEQVGSDLPCDRRRRGVAAREHDQGDPRPRPPDLRPDRRDARAVVPERPLRPGGSFLRGCRARDRAPAVASDACSARGWRRCDRRRRRLQPCAPRRPLDV